MSKLLAEWFWVDRWMGSSAFLLPIEKRGLYREMLTQAWRRGGKLPVEHESIMRAVGCTQEEWDRCWPSIRRYWKEVDGHLVNETQVEVRAEAEARQERARDKAKKAAEARWGRDAQAMHEHSESNARGMPSVSVSVSGSGTDQLPPPPSPPPGGRSRGSTPSRRQKKPRPLWDGTLPEALETETFRAVWKEWCEWRATEHKDRDPVTQLSAKRALNELAEWGEERAIRAIHHTIAKQWKGIREPENGQVTDDDFEKMAKMAEEGRL